MTQVEGLQRCAIKDKTEVEVHTVESRRMKLKCVYLYVKNNSHHHVIQLQVTLQNKVSEGHQYRQNQYRDYFDCVDEIMDIEEA